jgi:hypothetical protein
MIYRHEYVHNKWNSLLAVPIAHIIHCKSYTDEVSTVPHVGDDKL